MSADEVDSRNPLRLTTKEFADRNLVQAQTIHKRYSQTGSYFGVRPCKLANGRLSWPCAGTGSKKEDLQ